MTVPLSRPASRGPTGPPDGQSPVAATLSLRRTAVAGADVAGLSARLFSPLCGILTDVTTLARSRYGPQAFVYSGELTGVHLWSHLPDPPAGSFHLGGFGLHRHEALVKLLGESVERYSGHAAAAAGLLPVRMASHAELAAEGARTLTEADFELFRDDQFSRPGFPFSPFSPGATLGWAELTALTDGHRALVPAQAVLLGYVLGEDEPWLQTAVTTGTAVHPEPGRALRSALEELTQVDAAIGHWHGRRPSLRLLPDRRTAELDRVIARHTWRHAPAPEFHLLPSPDLPGFTIACLIRAAGEAIPRVAVGLGSGTVLVRAMYRAFLEAVGVAWLAGWVQVRDGSPGAEAGVANPYDLESNVGYYAGPAGAVVVDKRFADCTQIAASDAPPDGPREDRAAVARLCEAIAASGQRIYHADLTTPDVRRLGLSAQRVWSPDLLALPLPGAAPMAHRRWAAYGGVCRDDPHPYP
ncbi:MAG TPA: YcaO-like family protein [Streptosporangiaceae bacterium]|nr:YcaO-like family protein [Streptosporangiaceae bacterium]